MNIDVIFLAYVYEKFTKVSVEEIEISPLYRVSLQDYTHQGKLKIIKINLLTLQGKYMIPLLENIVRGRISSVMGDKFVFFSDENEKKIIDANNFYGHSMAQSLPYDEIKCGYNGKLEDILKTPDDSDIVHLVETDLKYSIEIKENSKNFPFCPENEKTNPDTYTQTKKLSCDWTDKKKFLIHYRMLNFHVRHGIIVEKVHKIIPFKQSKWLGKFLNFDTQKRNKAKNEFQEGSYKLLNIAFFGKCFAKDS